VRKGEGPRSSWLRSWRSLSSGSTASGGTGAGAAAQGALGESFTASTAMNSWAQQPPRHSSSTSTSASTCSRWSAARADSYSSEEEELALDEDEEEEVEIEEEEEHESPPNHDWIDACLRSCCSSSSSSSTSTGSSSSTLPSPFRTDQPPSTAATTATTIGTVDHQRHPRNHRDRRCPTSTSSHALQDTLLRWKWEYQVWALHPLLDALLSEVYVHAHGRKWSHWHRRTLFESDRPTPLQVPGHTYILLLWRVRTLVFSASTLSGEKAWFTHSPLARLVGLFPSLLLLPVFACGSSSTRDTAATKQSQTRQRNINKQTQQSWPTAKSATPASATRRPSAASAVPSSPCARTA
jgi:hypothetical protein